MVKRYCSLGSKPRLHGALRDKWEKSCKTSLYTSEGDYTFLKRQNMQFNYLLSWHVVVMKERVSNINRAKLTSQMGFRRGNPSAIHLHIKLLSTIWDKIHVFQPLRSNHPFILHGCLICTSCLYTYLKERGKSCRNKKLLSVGTLQWIPLLFRFWASA